MNNKQKIKNVNTRCRVRPLGGEAAQTGTSKNVNE
jgi:hypothetical protein